MKTTDELLKILQKSTDIKKFVGENNISFIDISLREYLETMMLEKNISLPEIIKGSNLTQIYCYKIFSGDRIPKRNKLLAICFGLKLNLAQTQQALRIAGHSLLYPKIKRDSIIIFAINNGSSLIDCNEVLYELGEPIIE